MISALAFLKIGFRHKRMLLLLAAADLRQRYIGAAGGVIWLFAPPLAAMAVYWLIFSVGFKVGTVTNMPFALWFVAGLVPWLLFSESVTNSISAVSRNAHFVKSVVFPTETLPLVQLMGASIVHVVLLLPILVAVILLSGLPLQLLQLPYYAVATLAFALGWAWLLAALNLFLRDVAPAMTIVLNLWFWLTPIAWPARILAPEIQRWMWLNPLYYLVQGYRDSLFGGAWLWQAPWAAASFWVICFATLAIGAAAFRRLKPAFAEVV